MREVYDTIPHDLQKHLAAKLDRNEPFTLVITQSRVQLTIPPPTDGEVMFAAWRDVLIAGVLISLIATLSTYLA